MITYKKKFTPCHFWHEGKKYCLGGGAVIAPPPPQLKVTYPESTQDEMLYLYNNGFAYLFDFVEDATLEIEDITATETKPTKNKK